MLRFLCTFTIALHFVAHAEACVNEFGTTLNGKVKMIREAYVPPAIKIDVQRYRQKIAELSPLIKQPTYFSDGNFREASDLAVAHLYVGETDRAIELLEQVEKSHPNEYVVAANLGTAYELAGRNEEALKWIEEGVRRNPKSHDGSEWIHVNLLRAKIALTTDPAWLSKHSATGLDFGTDSVPVHNLQTSTSNCPANLSDVYSHLHYQLHERRQFIPGSDPIVASLMFDLANTTALTSTIEASLPIYQAALDLGYPNPSLIDLRVRTLQELRRTNWISGWGIHSIITAVFFSLVAIISCLILFRLSTRIGLGKSS